MAAMKPPTVPGAAPRLLARALGLALLLSPAACVSLKVALPPDPQEVVAALAVVTAPPGSLDLERPVADQAADEAAEAVHALIKVLNVNRALALQWHWYSPENKRIRLSKSVAANARGRTLAYFAAWDTLPRAAFAGMKGTWTVVVSADGRFLARKYFAVK